MWNIYFLKFKIAYNGQSRLTVCLGFTLGGEEEPEWLTICCSQLVNRRIGVPFPAGAVIFLLSTAFSLFLDSNQLPRVRGFMITLNDAPQSVGILWTNDQSVAETSTWQKHNSHNRQTSMPPGGIRTHDRSRRAAVDLRIRPRGHWARLNLLQPEFYI